MLLGKNASSGLDIFIFYSPSFHTRYIHDITKRYWRAALKRHSQEWGQFLRAELTKRPGCCHRTLLGEPWMKLLFRGWVVDGAD